MLTSIFLHIKRWSLLIYSKQTIGLIVYVTFPMLVVGQSPRELFMQYKKEFESANFIKSEQYLLRIEERKSTLKPSQLVVVYNELGIVSKLLGKYSKAIYFYIEGAKLTTKSKNVYYSRASIYNNIGNIYKHLGDFEKALIYFRESITLSSLIKKPRKKDLILAHAFNGMGLVNLKQNKYPEANQCFKKSINLCVLRNFKEKGMAFFNYANCLREQKEIEGAVENYKKSISIIKSDFGNDDYNLSSVYKSYGKLKAITGNFKEAKELYNKALNIYLNTYGNKHPYTADMYKIYGDFYLVQDNIEKALNYYQKSLIANSNSFNEKDVFKNPTSESTFSKMHLLRSLKKKAETLALLFNKKKEEELLHLSNKTINLAIKTIESVREEYLSQESKLFITKNEKGLYIKAIDNLIILHENTRKNEYLKLAYQYSRESKALVLKNEIKEHETLRKLLPDSLLNKYANLKNNIKSLKKLIVDEYVKGKADQKPNQEKITQWRSQAFQLTDKYEKLIFFIEKHYPLFKQLKSKNNTLSLPKLQNSLQKGEAIIEYSYSPKQLYTFILSKNKLKYHKQTLNSNFIDEIYNYKEIMGTGTNTISSIDDFNHYYKNLYELYKTLIKPLNLSNTQKMLIIPDEELSNIAFEALVDSFKPASVINYARQSYLLHKYNISYAYSCDFFLNKPDSHETQNFIHAFAPSYRGEENSLTRNSDAELKHTKSEIDSALFYFTGKAYLEKLATKENFCKTLKKGGIFHLAMHAKSNPEHPEYSYLSFNSSEDKNNVFYNYELNSTKINAPLAVLSACNSGQGKLFSGEGVMSISRSFLLAGVPSIVHGLWKIDDRSSAKIISAFYRHLSEGQSKDEALRFAKIEYLKTSHPEQTHPVYWSGLVLTGNRAPLVKKTYNLYIILSILLAILAVLFIGYKFKIRKH